MIDLIPRRTFGADGPDHDPSDHEGGDPGGLEDDCFLNFFYAPYDVARV